MSNANPARRLAAIVAADVVGYSRLMRNDEEGTLSSMRALQTDVVNPSIQVFGGRVVKTMGDGFLLEFPSIVEAIRCSIDIQQKLRDRNTDRQPRHGPDQCGIPGKFPVRVQPTKRDPDLSGRPGSR